MVAHRALMFPELQQVAQPDTEFLMVDRREQEIGRPGLKRLVAKILVLIDRDDL